MDSFCSFVVSLDGAYDYYFDLVETTVNFFASYMFVVDVVIVDVAVV